MQRQHKIRAVMEVGEGVFKRRFDTEEFHENDSEEVERFIRRQLEEVDELMNQRDPTAGPTGTATRPNGKVGGSSMGRLGKLTQYRLSLIHI